MNEGGEENEEKSTETSTEKDETVDQSEKSEVRSLKTVGSLAPSPYGWLMMADAPGGVT